MNEGYLNTEPYAFPIGRMVTAYLEAIDFTEETEWSDEVIGYAEGLENQASGDCVAFLDLCERANVSLQGMEPEQVGQDFWLTRNGHGAGFWDRGLGDRGYRLSDLAHSFGECHVMEGDDHYVYYVD